MVRIPVAACLLLVALAGCAGGEEGPTGGGAQVDIHNFTFDPATIQVAVGTVVHFTNHDTAAHTATANGGAFDTGTLTHDQSGEVHLDRAGTFAYHCKIHPNMKGTIIVA
jgi:plastocyanin